VFNHLRNDNSLSFHPVHSMIRQSGLGFYTTKRDAAQAARLIQAESSTKVEIRADISTVSCWPIATKGLSDNWIRSRHTRDISLLLRRCGTSDKTLNYGLTNASI
jgi:hypothetical protein